MKSAGTGFMGEGSLWLFPFIWRLSAIWVLLNLLIGGREIVERFRGEEESRMS